ncbi:electron transfer flavoprotein, alpha subunit [Candidatus Koribacter versatilis Ellin345]|uniref:Electron transfer flavoprotein, alpha subunit n=1 Tax=Koribacter versatilis (strain Ellin345) TaxID=204669 RepID=Q1IUI2_KORVE|nr:electron transfer flavoprotein subunit alpha/FixB family protein [Candidatus Koribacter versatilis]ABF39468.1 electron transfer flavoprotein, alpha subunit [Candidatus Koribacter versatilis Ellin345]
MNPIFLIALQRNGALDDTVAELIATAKTLDPTVQATAIACGYGPELDAVCAALTKSVPTTWKISHEQFATFNAEAIREGLVRILPKGAIVLVAHDHFGMDLAPGLSVKLGAAYVPDVLVVEAGQRLVRQEFAGQFNARMECDFSGGAVITVRPGVFKPGSQVEVNGVVVDKSSEVSAISVRRRYVTTIPAQVGDVDITKQTVLVSVGRGIQEAENIELAQELADALGGAVSCSRPVVDAKWLDKSRQVGSSGATVSPKVYLACGISGSFQHMAGIKGSPFLVAINKNPAAPIFQFADVGIVDDLLEFLPALTERVRELTERQGTKQTASAAH